VGLFTLGMGCAALKEAWQRWQRSWQHPRRCIAQLTVGSQVSFHGMLTSQNSLLKSYISQTPCAFWQVQLLAISSGVKGVPHATLMKTLHSQAAIMVQDHTGEIPVHIAQATVELCNHDHLSDAQDLLRRFQHPGTLRFLEEIGLEQAARRHRTVIERILRPGDKLVVWGKVVGRGNVMVVEATHLSDSDAYQHYGTLGALLVGLMASYIGLGVLWYALRQLWG
jgi:hypothetical protein